MLVIPLWAGLGIFESSDSPAAAGHLASHGHGGGGGESIGDASAAAAAFNEEHTRPDGCVDPDYHPEEAPVEAPVESTEGHAHGGGDAEGESESDGGHSHDSGASSSDATTVYVQAYSYGYLPERLCLKAGTPYLFKLMAIDVTHGWTIQLGTSSSVMRLPPGVVVERELTFTEPGTYLVYCSYYCGLGHPRMRASIIVEPEHGP